MSARSTQARQLGYEVIHELGLHHAEVRWSGQRKTGSFGGWRVEWTNGPSVPGMRTFIERHAARFPAVPIADLGYDRCGTGLAEAIALLLYVDRDRSWVDCIETSLIPSAFDAVDWPERADQVWFERARALLRHTPDASRSTVTAYAVRALARHARVGWDNALAWLDRLVVEHGAVADATNIVDLASRRETYLANRVRQQR
jgi:hypothetical protein